MTEATQRYETVDMNYLQIDDEGYVTKICNPITRSWALVIPPPPIENVDLGALQYKWNQYCLAAWDLPTRRDPQVINPSLLLDDKAQVDVLDSTLFGLVQEHGYWAVRIAVEKLDPNAEPPLAMGISQLSPVEPVPIPEAASKDRPQPRPIPYRVGSFTRTSDTEIGEVG